MTRRQAATPLSQLIGGHPAPVTDSTGQAYLERALINPVGADPGHEAVVLGNYSTTTTSLHGWRIVDRNRRETKLDVVLAGGASAVVALDGTGIQLGNNGGNLVLLDDRGQQMDSVTYAASEASAVDRFVRFRR